jgi:hypothetical protein
VTGILEVRPGVLVLGRIAASHVSTGLADTKGHPGISGFQTLLAPLRGAGFDVRIDLICVCAFHKLAASTDVGGIRTIMAVVQLSCSRILESADTLIVV